MKLVDDTGSLVDAELTVELTDRGDLVVVLESAGGTGRSTRSRNREYPAALETLLRRLSAADATLLDVLVDSRRTKSLPVEERRVHPAPWTYPVELRRDEDFARLRLAITRPQGNIGSTARGGGNGRKRIRLTFALPGRLTLEEIRTLLRVAGQPSSHPEPLAPEIADAHLAAELSAGRRGRGQGFIQDVKQKLAIEQRAVEITSDFLTTQGFDVDNVGATQSFDLDARRGSERLQVEVKGTTSPGAQVILTRREVEVHKAAYPNNALAIVHSIELGMAADEPTALGGVLVWRSPWLVEDGSLKPISFEYTTGL